MTLPYAKVMVKKDIGTKLPTFFFISLPITHKPPTLKKNAAQSLRTLVSLRLLVGLSEPSLKYVAGYRRPCKILCTYDCHMGSILEYH